MASQAHVDPARLVLDGVPRVHFYDGGERCPEDITFPSCLRAYLDFVRDSLGCKHAPTREGESRVDCGYAYLMGTSGAAFFLSWKPGWHLDNMAIEYMSADSEAPYRRAFESVGYAYEIIRKDNGRDNEAYFRSRITESIRDRGRPVIAEGVIGPPEACLVAGYDNGGEVLIGWNFFQGFPDFSGGVELEPSGYFRKGDWFKDTWSLIVVGDKHEPPPLRRACRNALEWALTVVRTPMPRGGRYNGLTAYAGWAEDIVRDQDFPADDMSVLREHHMVHHNAVGMVAEGRWYGAQFLKEVAARDPELAEEVRAAAGCYEAEHDLMWEIWNLAGGNGMTDAHVIALADPAARRAIAPIILRARDQDAEAAEHLERALARAH
jgi:hypothetical protein